MARKHVVKYRATERKFSLTSLAGNLHQHFCRNRDCRTVYEDNCHEPQVNRCCTPCSKEVPGWGIRTGVASRTWRWREPSLCCYGNCAVVTTKDVIERYKLAGPGPWFQCKSCFKAHGWPCANVNERK